MECMAEDQDEDVSFRREEATEEEMASHGLTVRRVGE